MGKFMDFVKLFKQGSWIKSAKKFVGDNSKLRALGWEPVIPFEQTLKDIFANWMERLDA